MHVDAIFSGILPKKYGLAALTAAAAHFKRCATFDSSAFSLTTVPTQRRVYALFKGNLSASLPLNVRQLGDFTDLLITAE